MRNCQLICSFSFHLHPFTLSPVLSTAIYSVLLLVFQLVVSIHGLGKHTNLTYADYQIVTGGTTNVSYGCCSKQMRDKSEKKKGKGSKCQQIEGRMQQTE
jgi:hypothetical protein